MVLGVLVTVLGFYSAASHAIAFCALRDPTHQIYDLYPQATGYRSLVGRVEREVRDDIGSNLPFTLHNRELGQHTLYVALAHEQPLGLVHVRSESSKWGLIEIVWSLDLNLRIRDFRFQRCRDAACAALVEEPFKSVLLGKTLDELRQLIGEDGHDIDMQALPVKPAEQ